MMLRVSEVYYSWWKKKSPDNRESPAGARDAQHAVRAYRSTGCTRAVRLADVNGPEARHEARYALGTGPAMVRPACRCRLRRADKRRILSGAQAARTGGCTYRRKPDGPRPYHQRAVGRAAL